MKKMIWCVVGVAVTAGLVASSVACSDDKKTQSPTEATGALCNDIDALQTSVGALTNLNATSTINGAKTAVAQVGDALGQVRSGVQDVRTARVDALQQSVDKLKTSVASISGDQSIPDTLATLQPDVAGVVTAGSQVLNSANCR